VALLFGTRCLDIETPCLREIEESDGQRSQAIESLEISDNSVNIRRWDMRSN
jgi:hypothetical protein